jgi:hypothetical protein
MDKAGSGPELLRKSRWPVGLASIFQSHRLLQRQIEERDAEIVRLRDENAAYRDLVLMLRSVPPLKRERKEASPQATAPLSGRPTMADIQRKNRLRMMEEAARASGGGTEQEREENRRRLAAAADEYAQEVQGGSAEFGVRNAE